MKRPEPTSMQGPPNPPTPKRIVVVGFILGTLVGVLSILDFLSSH